MGSVFPPLIFLFSAGSNKETATNKGNYFTNKKNKAGWWCFSSRPVKRDVFFPPFYFSRAYPVNVYLFAGARSLSLSLTSRIVLSASFSRGVRQGGKTVTSKSFLFSFFRRRERGRKRRFFVSIGSVLSRGNKKCPVVEPRARRESVGRFSGRVSRKSRGGQ